MELHPEWNVQLYDLLLKVKVFPYDDTEDILIVRSLKDIIGLNMTYIDHIIFYDVPKSFNEIRQIIGRTIRIGRREYA